MCVSGGGGGVLFPGIPIVFCSLSLLRKWQENMGTTRIVIFFPMKIKES